MSGLITISGSVALISKTKGAFSNNVWLLELKHGFSVEDLEKKIMASRIDDKLRKHLSVTYERLMGYNKINVTKAQVQMLIKYLRDLVYIISKNYGK